MHKTRWWSTVIGLGVLAMACALGGIWTGSEELACSAAVFGVADFLVVFLFGLLSID